MLRGSSAERRFKRRGIWGGGLQTRPGSGLATRIWFGIAFVTVGVLWTLDNLRILDSDRAFEWWPVLLIGFGVSKLLDRRAHRSSAGWLWIAIGSVLLLQHLGYIPWGLHELWPVVLILIGAGIVWRGFHGPGTNGGHRGTTDAWPGIGAPASGSAATDAGGDAGAGRDASTASAGETFSAVAIWSGVERMCTSQSFRGGDFTAIMGGGTVDVRGAKPVPGGATIDLTVLMGGVEILVPDDWAVVNEIQCIMGGVEEIRTAAPPAPGLVLHVRGIVLMGGVEIRNARDA